MATAAPKKITIGTEWVASGRTWVVYELLPFGLAKVRSGLRFGEMRRSDIRTAIAAAANARIASTDAWLRLVDANTDNECWVVCAEGDPGAVQFVPAEAA